MKRKDPTHQNMLWDRHDRMLETLKQYREHLRISMYVATDGDFLGRITIASREQDKLFEQRLRDFGLVKSRGGYVIEHPSQYDVVLEIVQEHHERQQVSLHHDTLSVSLLEALTKLGDDHQVQGLGRTLLVRSGDDFVAGPGCWFDDAGNQGANADEIRIVVSGVDQATYDRCARQWSSARHVREPRGSAPRTRLSGFAIDPVWEEWRKTSPRPSHAITYRGLCALLRAPGMRTTIRYRDGDGLKERSLSKGLPRVGRNMKQASLALQRRQATHHIRQHPRASVAVEPIFDSLSAGFEAHVSGYVAAYRHALSYGKSLRELDEVRFANYKTTLAPGALPEPLARRVHATDIPNRELYELLQGHAGGTDCPTMYHLHPVARRHLHDVVTVRHLDVSSQFSVPKGPKAYELQCPSQTMAREVFDADAIEIRMQPARALCPEHARRVLSEHAPGLEARNASLVMTATPLQRAQRNKRATMSR